MHHIQPSALFYISLWECDGDERHCACWAWIKSVRLDNFATLTGFTGIRATMPVRVSGASRNTIKDHLKALVEQGHLVLHGAGRGAWYGLA